ncbi:Transcription initiation factor IIA subunit 2 [Astathelohania contejeani]|uniref:Transcription initiation factor IIA subunit 2 n=1 Tax=Astathelohania contejeani TaxID=164912 RepID=A0ABQ7HXT2_9MICR|nr:Transcription initiation factor IIA subunit 2 [Thelohania contejeani]
MYEFYRQSKIGQALQDSIEDIMRSNRLTPTQANQILQKFDEAIPVVFARTVQSNINFKGAISSYNFVDGVWKFSTRNFVMTVNNELIRCDYVKIVACDSDTSVDVGRRKRKPKNISG